MTTNLQRGFNLSRSKNGYSANKRRSFPMTNGYATSLGKGDPVKVSAGYICKAVNGNTIIGVFDGCKYVDPNFLQTREIDLWVGGTTMPSGSVVDGRQYPVAFVNMAEGNYFEIIADGAITQAQLGLTFPVSNGTPNVQYRRSTVVVNASAQATTANAMVRVTGFPQQIITNPGDTPTLVEVEFISYGYAS